MSDASEPRVALQRQVRARSWQVRVILTLFFIAVAGAAGIGWWYARESPPHKGPIILITVDGLGAAGVGTKPATAVTWPEAAVPAEPSALSALAEDAVIFDRAYTHSPQLLPAQASLLSGRLPFEHGVRDDAGFVLRPDTLTLPELLHNRGFSTGAAVSTFLLRESTGVAHGFSTYTTSDADDTDVGPATPVPVAPHAAGSLPTDDVRVARSIGQDSPDSSRTAESAATVGDRSIEAAAAWATRQNGQRYFLMLEVDADHAESAVAKVVSLLREHHLYDNATIVLVGERGRVDGSIDEETLHVPLLVKQPQREGAGRHIPVAVQHIDLLPTILDLVRAPIPAGLRGRSLKPLLTETSGQISPQPIYSESLAAAYRFGGQPTFALTLNDLRYVRSGAETLVRVGADTAVSTVSDGERTATASGEMPPLRATLDRMLATRPFARAAPVAARDRDRLARAGVLPGLQTIADTSGLTHEQQDAIAATHRDAARLIGAGRLSSALRALQQIVKSDRTLAPVQFQIGRISSELGRTSEAIAAFEEAAASRPDAPEITRALALTLLRAGRTAEAETQIAAAIESASRFGAVEIAAAHAVAARIALARDQPDAALEHADMVQKANPSIPMHALVQGELLAKNGDTEEAARLLRGAAAMVRQHDRALEGLQVTLGQVLATLKETQPAEAAFRAELADFPRSIAAYTELAQLLHAAGRDEEASALAETLLMASPTPDGYAAAAKVWMLLGETARAAEVRADARTRFPAESAPGRLARVKTR